MRAALSWLMLVPYAFMPVLFIVGLFEYLGKLPDGVSRRLASPIIFLTLILWVFGAFSLIFEIAS